MNYTEPPVFAITFPRRLTVFLRSYAPAWFPLACALAMLVSLLASGPFGCKRRARSELPPVQDASIALEKKGNPDPLADSRAQKGGSITVWGANFPKSLNYWLDANSLSGSIAGLMFETLADLHSLKNRAEGNLAASWRVLDGGRTFVFKIRPQAKWSDGVPVTARDFQFYYDVIMNKKHLTSPFRVQLRRLHRPEVVDKKTLRVRVKKTHWKNFWTAAGLFAFPAHAWRDKDFNKINYKFPVVSGPYKIRDLGKDRYLLLERRGDWWGRSLHYNRHKFNFDYIRYRFIGDRNKALIALRKGDFDLYPIYTSSIWVKRTKFDSVKKNWVVRQRVYNRRPKGFQGFAVNMRREKFKDIRVREALSHLLNRSAMNEKFMFNVYFLLNTHFPDLYPNNVNPRVSVRKYDPARARALLKEAGWKVGPKGFLEKNGKRFTLKFLTYDAEKRHLELYLGDLRKVGIDASIDQTTLSTARKRLDEFNYDMFWTAWGASRLRDPESNWHSSTANQKASFNFPGLKDREVDRLIDAMRLETNLDRRNALMIKLDERLYRLIPYVLLWQSAYHRVLYWNRYGRPAHMFGKYGDEDSALVYWWLDKKKSAALEKAMSENKPLAAEPRAVRYGDK